MIRANIHEAKTHFSEYLAKIKAGETVLICKRNIPIAEIRPIPQRSTDPRPIGLGKDTFTLPPAFFDSLPSEFIAAFHDSGK